MDSQKIVAAIETAAKKNGIIQSDVYRESHALYHAIIEALHGVTRGQMQLGSVLRTVGLSFAVLRGNPYDNEQEGGLDCRFPVWNHWCASKGIRV